MSVKEIEKYIGHTFFTVIQATSTQDTYEYVVKEDGAVYPYVIVQSKAPPFIYSRKPYIAKKHI
jgi:hypothetical protein